ncbi:MAG: M23 family metallopeptidase, partial [Peptococcaceae bacterium]|nr:M23 family metallopeptidase [Peptococcaceae bacterium]
MRILQIKVKKIQTLIAVFSAAVVLCSACPAFARLDELVVDGAPYIAPPVVAAVAPQVLYEVKPGDTLLEIARKNNLSLDTLAAANSLSDPDKICSGQLLKVPSDCLVHRVQPGETLLEIAGKYNVEANQIGARNGLANLNSIAAGQKILIPCNSRSQETSAVSRGQAAWPMSWPLAGVITSPFGPRDGKQHEGIDIAAEEGTPVRATAAGRVVFAGPRGTYGLAVIIDHGDGTRTLYAHCSKLLVAEGSSVDTSTVIALSGNTGRSTGPHLHLEVLKNGVPLNPLNYL